jgi:hypothetical protein
MPNISNGKRYFLDTLITAVKTQRFITTNKKQIRFKIGDQAILRTNTKQYAKFGRPSGGNLSTIVLPLNSNYDHTLMATPFMSRQNFDRVRKRPLTIIDAYGNRPILSLPPQLFYGTKRSILYAGKASTRLRRIHGGFMGTGGGSTKRQSTG